MYINHRRDGDLFARAMDRDNAEAFAAMAAAASTDDPIEDEHHECFGCGREIIGEVRTDWSGEPLCGLCAYAADGDHYGDR